jgi:REP element-mobilizing transposase RayT
MAIPRRFLVREGQVSLIHVIARCVRRAWLCGVDQVTGKSYEHRKVWIKERLKFLTRHFSVEVCGYAIMSSHYHAMLQIRPDRAATWSPQEVARRWWFLFPKRRDTFGNPLEPKDHELNEILSDPRSGDPLGRLEVLRGRLGSISWFMRCLNENIARRANREDQCTGRFWEGRFKSTELLDQSAVLACLTYIELNPIRAGVAISPETSDFTSGQDRIRAKVARDQLKAINEAGQQTKARAHHDAERRMYQNRLEEQAKLDQWLSPLALKPVDQEGKSQGPFLNITLEDYLKILDWTGRQVRLDKRGAIPQDLAPILERMAIETDQWLHTVDRFNSLFHRVAGRLKTLQDYALSVGRKWLAGSTAAKTVFQ